jgi:glycolate oxidase FAD binding subunit
MTFVAGTGDGGARRRTRGEERRRLRSRATRHGAWGTLGVVTEVSVRLRALPEVDATVAVAPPSGVQALAPWLARVRATPLHAWALELVNGPLAAHLALGERPLLLARLAGNAPLVAAQRARSPRWATSPTRRRRVGAAARLRARRAPSWRGSRRAPTRLAALCAELFAPAARAFGLLAHATRRAAWCASSCPGAEGIRHAAPDADAAGSPPRAPSSACRRRSGRASAPLGRAGADDPLSRRVRDAFDPARVLNPGILGAPDAAPHARRARRGAVRAPRHPARRARSGLDACVTAASACRRARRT